MQSCQCHRPASLQNDDDESLASSSEKRIGLLLARRRRAAAATRHRLDLRLLGRDLRHHAVLHVAVLRHHAVAELGHHLAQLGRRRRARRVRRYRGYRRCRCWLAGHVVICRR